MVEGDAEGGQHVEDGHLGSHDVHDRENRNLQSDDSNDVDLRNDFFTNSHRNVPGSNPNAA